LMPPWAQTECDRFTGTSENRSTGKPDSAIRILAARPARPPPTTMTRCCAEVETIAFNPLWVLPRCVGSGGDRFEVGVSEQRSVRGRGLGLFWDRDLARVALE